MSYDSITAINKISSSQIKEIKLSEVGNKCPSTVTSTSQTLTSTKTLQIIFMSIDDASGEIRYPKEVLPEGQGTKKDNTGRMSNSYY